MLGNNEFKLLLLHYNDPKLILQGGVLGLSIFLQSTYMHVSNDSIKPDSSIN